MTPREPVPAGTYWNDALKRHVEPTDPDWSSEEFAGLVRDAIEAPDWRDNPEGMPPCEEN